MGNDHVGAKRNQLKVSESPLGQLRARKAATWPVSSGLVRHVVEILQVRCHDDPHFADSASRKLFIGWWKLSRDTDVANKHCFYVLIKTRRAMKGFTLNFENCFGARF